MSTQVDIGEEAKWALGSFLVVSVQVLKSWMFAKQKLTTCCSGQRTCVQMCSFSQWPLCNIFYCKQSNLDGKKAWERGSEDNTHNSNMLPFKHSGLFKAQYSLSNSLFALSTVTTITVSMSSSVSQKCPMRNTLASTLKYPCTMPMQSHISWLQKCL